MKTKRHPNETPYTRGHLMIECLCGGWHIVEGFWVGDDELHTSPIECEGIRKHGALEGQRCGRKIICSGCESEYCSVLEAEMKRNDPSETEMRAV